jgi:toxin ParE1/3/4
VKSSKAKVVFEVLISEGAEHDLEQLCDYIAEHDSVKNANYVLNQLLQVAATLSTFPERGAYPKELAAIGIKDYRQVSFKPYRVIYSVAANQVNQVIVHLIADGRRDMQSLLLQRLLR